MRISHVQFSIALLLVAASIVISAEPSTPAPDATIDYAAKVDAMVKQLDGPAKVDAQAAEIQLSLLPPEAFGAIEAAAEKPGLSANASTRLKRFIAKQQSWQAARIGIERSKLAQWKSNSTTALAAYDKSGNRSPKWDAAARKGIELFVTPPASLPKGSSARMQLEKAIAAGCNDPLVLYMAARLLPGTSDNDAIERLLDKAVAGFEKSQYPASRKIRCFAWCYLTKHEVEEAKLQRGQLFPRQVSDALNHLNDVTKQTLPGMAEEKMTAPEMLDVSNLVLTTFLRDRKDMFDALFPVVEKASPDESTTLTIKGRFYINYAWQARGSDWAQTVTEDGWKGFRERLEVASDALTKAWEKDNTNATAATQMISVELGQGQGRNRMELWFRRAMEADPDNREACMAKIYYLEPKWHGKPEDLIIFGHQLVEDENWRGMLPLRLVDVHQRLSGYASSRQEYFSMPEVWKDMESVYVPYLRAQPENTNMRNAYCYYACACGKWAVAKKQFELLGNRIDPVEFGGAEKLKEFREQAEQQGSSPTTP